MVVFRLSEHLRYLRELAHEDLVIETPPMCQALWERGQAAGFHLGRLYVLRRPLTPGVGGEYHPRSGDIWVLHDPARPEQVARTLLHELAHAQRPPAAPAPTIDASCDEEAATEERTRDLADAWGVADLFGDEDLRAALVAVETLRERLTAAGELAGTLALAAARAAYAALLRLAGEAGWAGATLDDALFGVADDATVARALDFDRCALRGRWRLGWGAGIDFGSLALAPDAASGALLRSGLRAVAEGRPPAEGHPTGHGPVADPPGDAAYAARAEGDDKHCRFAFLRLEGWQDLAPALAAANAALLAHQDRYALATWDCYGDAADHRTQRLYRLWVRYGSDDRDRPNPPDAQLWVLAMPHRPRDLRAEAALQQYLRGWRVHTALRVEDWWTGLDELSEQIQTTR